MSEARYVARAVAVDFAKKKILGGMLSSTAAAPDLEELSNKVAAAANELAAAGYRVHSIAPLTFPTNTKDVGESLSGGCTRGALLLGEREVS